MARRQARKITRAAGVAAFSGWTLAVFAAISIVSGIFGLPALLLGLGLSAVAFIELRGSKGLRAFDLDAPRLLAINQIGLILVVVAYAGWGIYAALTGPGPYDEQLLAGGPIAKSLEPIDRLTRSLTVAFYLALIGGSLIAQGCAAAYYITRRGHMEAYLRSTPSWVIQALRAASG